MISRPPKTIELPRLQVLKIFKHPKPECFARLFYQSEEDPFGVTTCHKKG